MEFRLIPFGESEKNLELCVQYNVIGLPKRKKIAEGELLYFALKKSSKWYVCGKARFEGETDNNPFENPERYYTYSVKDIETCNPFEINTILKDELGMYWGLTFQSPKILKNKAIESYIEGNFKALDRSQMLKKLRDK